MFYWWRKKRYKSKVLHQLENSFYQIIRNESELELFYSKTDRLIRMITRIRAGEDVMYVLMSE